MKTAESINEDIKKLGKCSILGTKKEITHLPNVLSSEENILALTSGFMDGNTWLIVLTQKRVLFIDKGMFFGVKQIDMPLRKINSIAHKTGMFLGEIHIWDGASKTIIKNCDKESVPVFVNKLNELMEGSEKEK